MAFRLPTLFAYTAVDFIIHEYGMEKLDLLLRAPEDMEDILEVTNKTFEDGWLEFYSHTISQRSNEGIQ